MSADSDTTGVVEVGPIIDPRVQGVCCSPYPGRPRGCPNFNMKYGCPPKMPLWGDVARGGPALAVWLRFDLAAQETRMLAANPGWTKRQARCLLYWQAGQRKRMKLRVRGLVDGGGARAFGTICPEAFGVDVLATMRDAGVRIEWPIERWATMVAFVAVAREGSVLDASWWHVIGPEK